jgi:hypothetical protein
VAQIEDYFNSRYDDAHLVELNGLLARIEPTDAGDCAPDLT